MSKISVSHTDTRRYCRPKHSKTREILEQLEWWLEKYFELFKNKMEDLLSKWKNDKRNGSTRKTTKSALRRIHSQLYWECESQNARNKPEFTRQNKNNQHFVATDLRLCYNGMTITKRIIRKSIICSTSSRFYSQSKTSKAYSLLFEWLSKMEYTRITDLCSITSDIIEH